MFVILNFLAHLAFRPTYNKKFRITNITYNKKFRITNIIYNKKFRITNITYNKKFRVELQT
jgi:hypothetical protein